MSSPVDINGSPVSVGTTVRILSLSGQWLNDLPAKERCDVMSMVGEIFVVKEIDEYGQPWVSKSWSDEAEGACRSHSVALESHEVEVIQDGL